LEDNGSDETGWPVIQRSFMMKPLYAIEGAKINDARQGVAAFLHALFADVITTWI
jgi:hypothetical protein